MFRFGTTYGTDRQKDRENRVDTTSVGLAHARPNYTSDMHGIVGQAFATHVVCSRKFDDNEEKCVYTESVQ